MGRSTTAILLTSLIVACNGAIDGRPDGDSAQTNTPEPKPNRAQLTGVLLGNAAGIHYRTQQLEGLTDNSGAFTYYAGETVSFHLGGIVLGSALAAPRLDLFQIAGAEAPATETELVQAVLDDATITGFDRASNAAIVLLAFDRDDDPSNGIDLEGIDLTLTGKALTLVREHRDLYALLAAYAQRAEVAWNAVEPADAVAYIYRSMGRQVPAHARSSIFSDYNPADTAYDYSTINTYDTSGRLVTSEELATDPALSGTRVTYARDARGREIRRELVSAVPSSLASTQTRITETRRDARGQIALISESVVQGATLRYARTDELALDPRGRVVTWDLFTDVDGDATPDERANAAFEYDGTTVGYRMSFDTKVGTPYRATLFSGFDSNGVIVSRTETHDYGMDDVIDYDYQGEFQRDARGFLMSTHLQVSSNADGRPTSSVITYTRDNEGRIVRVETVYAESARRTVRELYFDSQHRSLGELTVDDRDGDGVVDLRIQIDVQRDGDGNVVARESRTSERFDGADVLTAHSLFTQRFEGGVPLVQSERRDDNGDGSFETEQSRRYAYTIIPDGVRYIVEHAAEWNE